MQETDSEQVNNTSMIQGGDECYAALIRASDWVGVGLNWLFIRESFSVEMTESPPLQISGDVCPIQ